MSTPAVTPMLSGMAPTRPVAPGPLAFPEMFYALRDAMTAEGQKPLATEKVAWRTIAADPTGKGVSYAALRKYEKGAPIGSNEETAPARFEDMKRTYAAIAGALEQPPEVFHEYRLLLARGELDEAVVGLTAALTTLEAVAGLGQLPPLRPALRRPRADRSPGDQDPAPPKSRRRSRKAPSQ